LALRASLQDVQLFSPPMSTSPAAQSVQEVEAGPKE
jgi:hypothetical protein